MRLVEDLGIRLLAREPHQVIVGHAAETAVPDWIETWSSTWPTTRTRLRVFSPEPPRACADARHYAADAAFGEKRDAGARTSHQCRTLFVVVGLQQLFESEGMSAIEIERPAAERQGEGRRAAGSLDKSAKRLHPGSRFLGSATSIRSVPRLGPHFDPEMQPPIASEAITSYGSKYAIGAPGRTDSRFLFGEARTSIVPIGPEDW